MSRESTRRLLLRVATGAVLLAAVLSGAVYWVEAEKELRILCGLSRVGTPVAEIDRLYGTATLLDVARDSVSRPATLRATSRRNLGMSSCAVMLEDGVVSRSVYTERLRLAQPAIVVALVAFGALTLLQVALAAGAPLGRLAWGGAHERLPVRLRVASGVVALVCAAGAVSAAILAGVVARPAARPAAEGMLGVLTLVFLLSHFANLASSSTRERWLGATLALLLGVSGVVLLLGG